MNKKILRKNLIETRKKILVKEKKSTIIVHKILKMDKYLNSNVIALYKSLKDEVNIDYLINYSLKLGKIILLPRVVGDDLIFIKIDLNTEYDKSKFGVVEPIYNPNNVYNGDIDLIIVPGVGFDINNHRIGYGKGFYDRFLKNKDIYKIGICFKEQLVNNLPIDDNDVSMNDVITD